MSDDPLILPYATPKDAPRWVSLHKFVSEFEARFIANQLEAAGVRWNILNATAKGTLALYGSMVLIDLQVHSDDLEPAKAVLREHLQADAAQLEPAEADDGFPRQGVDEDGNTVQLVSAGAFETANELREAALVLESARVKAYLPRLVPRGEAPARNGARFVLRVEDDDLDRAESVLSNQLADDEDVEPHCPRCGSWNVHEIKFEFRNMLLGLVGQPKPEQCECFKCRFRGPRSEFLGRG